MGDGGLETRDRFIVELMSLDDIPQVRRIEEASFPTPWPRNSYKREILENGRARYLVIRRVEPVPVIRSPRRPARRVRDWLWPFGMGDESDDIVAFGGLWLEIDEAHITTVAVRPGYRRRGLGELLVVEMARLSIESEVQRITLEVRLSNAVAQTLYRKYGFFEHGTRPRYYSDDFEDALIMWAEGVDAPEFAEMVERRGGQLAKKIRWESRV